MVKNHLKHSRLRLQIFTKIESICPRHTCNVSTKFGPNPIHNCLRYYAIYHFWPHLSMVKNHWKNSNSRIRIQIQIFTKIESVHPCHTLNPSTKFHLDTSTTFWDIPYTNRQTNRQTDKQIESGENITSFTFGGGSKYHTILVVYVR